MIVRVVTMSALLMLSAACTLSTNPPASQPARAPQSVTAPAGPVCVAIMETEVLADLPADQRQVLAGTLDTLLTESLAQQKDIALVDRQALEKVLAEHLPPGMTGKRNLNQADIAQVTADQVGESLRPFWSAGVLVCSRIKLDTDPVRKSSTLRVVIEAVSTQTGQVIAEYATRINWTPGQAAPQFKTSDLEHFSAQIRGNLARGAALPMVEVSPGQLTSSLTRLAWMRDDLDDCLRTHIAAQGTANLLVPRHPLFTKEERLLRIMGLAAVKESDPSAGLMAAPDGRVTMELIEHPTERVAFGKTPIALKMTWSHNGKSTVTGPIEGTVEEYDALRAKAVAWLDVQLASLTPQRADTERDEATCKRLALEELASVRQMLDANAVTLLGFFDNEPGTNALGARAFMHAARAAQLDPTNRQAARLVAMLVHCAYYRPGQEKWSQTAFDRAIIESQRYIDRFKVTPAQDDKVFYRLVRAGEWAAELEAGSRERMVNLTLTPQVNIYRYTRISAKAALEVGAFHALNDNGPMHSGHAHLWAGALRLRDWVMLNCPADELDGELAYWRKFWTDRVEKVPGDIPPWELVLTGYYTRKKDAAALRNAYNELAIKCPIRNSPAWSTAKVDIHLKLAGDANWKTWQVTFPNQSAPQYRLDISQCDAFFRRLIPQPNQASEFPYPYDCRRLFFPGEVLGAGYKTGGDRCWIEALAITDSDIWFVTPARGEQPPAGGARLFVCPLIEITSANAGKDIHPQPIEVPWPAKPNSDSAVPPTVKCCAVTHKGASATLWIGTLGCGVARMDNVDGKWKGRWYRGREGIPVDNIFWIAPCRYDGKEQLLMCGSSAARPPQGPVVWVLNPDSGESKILHEDVKNAAADRLALAWPDGRKLPLSVDDFRLFPGLDLKDATVVPLYAAGRMVNMPAPREGEAPRTWKIDSADGGEVDPRTLAPLTKAAAGPNQTDCLFVERSPGGNNIRMLSRNITYFGLKAASQNPFAVPRHGICQDGMFWLVDGQGYQLWGYAPAPAGDKDWADHDRWIGPFVPNGGGLILSLLPDSSGHLFATTTEFVDCLDTAALVKTADKSGRVHSTRQLQQKLHVGAEMPGWQGKVARALLEKRTSDALSVIDDQLAELGAVNEQSPVKRRELWVDLMLWQGLVQARAGYFDEASDLYHAVATSPLSDAPAKAMAHLNRIATLYRAKRWQDMLDEADAFGREFPDLKATPGKGRPLDPLPAQLADAVEKRALAAKNPELRPVDTHAPTRALHAPTPPVTTHPATPDASIGAQIIADYASDRVAAIASARRAGIDAVPGLIQGLKSSDPPTRLAAATLLRILPGRGKPMTNELSVATDALVAAAQNDPAVREQAFIAAPSFGPAAKAMVPLMLKSLGDEHESSHLRLLATMATSVAPDAPGLLDILLKNAASKDPLVCSSSIRALGALGKRSIAAKPLLAEALKSSDKQVRFSAIAAVHAIGLTPDEEISLLTPLLKDPEKMSRQWVVYNLGNLGPAGKSALPALVEAMKDPENWVKESAVQAVGKMGKAALPVIPDLKALTKNGAEPYLQEAVDHAIKAIERSEE